MRVCGNRMRMIARGLAASLAFVSGMPAVAEPSTVPPVVEPITTVPAVVRLKPRDSATPAEAMVMVMVHWRAVRVPAGILAGIPTGWSPTPPRLRRALAPVPVGFSADPYYSPPAVAVVPPPIVVAPFFAPPYFAPPLFAPPFLYDIAPIAWPSDGGCFVPSDFAGQHGYFGSCAEALYQQWTSRPY